MIVAGATGFAGALAAHLLWRHPGFELAGVTGRSEVGRSWTSSTRATGCRLTIEELDLDRLTSESGRARIDAAVVAYPHAAAAPIVGALRERGVRVVDLSADFRLRDLATYEQWYGTHPRPDLLDEAVYGLTELHREAIRDAGLVANPGLLSDGVGAGARAARPRGADRRPRDRRQAGHLRGRARVRRDRRTCPWRREHPPLQRRRHRHTPEIEEQLDELDPAHPRLRVQFQHTSCRSTRASWSAAT